MPYKNKEDQKKAVHRWYLKHKDSVKSRRAKTAKWFQNLKSTFKCVNCGEDHPATLDFHHRDPKEKDFGLAQATRRYGQERILKELEKCDVLCANCHRKIHDSGSSKD